ncbi:cysteine methyltransferase [Candidatus Roizmanbacteria bacterium CG_4_10_14_0_8_um_filter_36_36]|nr:MAG: cysteine methyltransferase [Candidatus Roizmanbacteria bacterium CG_4_10_14_0_8_um_filter_36_36]
MESSFKEKIYKLTKQIPKGKVVTYAQLARLAGSPKAARVVGLLMRNNPYAPQVPCHRVVGVDGSLVGYSAGKGTSSKREVLKKEGVKFKGPKVDLSASLWNGR